ncbi:tetratricopeptide repeat protein [Coraliomargarita parva]|uniref:tetratricopeptide repeat protein n=1 Tax=Coraliomargarita parva TaxID=3014050 RepID=UPI0022B419EC|nr:hypothetical protein [Coraliomargarita parva]
MSRPLVLLGGLLVSTVLLQSADLELPQLQAPAAAAETFKLPRPVPIRDINNNEQLLMGMDEGQLLISFPNMPGAEVIVPLDSDGLRLSVAVPDGYNDAVLAASRGDYGPIVQVLDPLAGPMMPFLRINARQTNLHPICLAYYKALVLGGQTDKAVQVSMKIPFESVSEDFSKLAEELLFDCIEQGRFPAVEGLLSRLMVSLPEDGFADIAFRAADALRTAGEHALSLKVYGTLVDSADTVLRQRSLLWAGYSSAVSGNPAQARDILGELDDLERGDENFVTYCLARGRTGLAEDNLREGLRYLSRAMVLTSVEASYKPELYYLLIRAYRGSGQEEASARLLREFEIFYPENPWLAKSRSESGETETERI